MDLPEVVWSRLALGALGGWLVCVLGCGGAADMPEAEGCDDGRCDMPPPSADSPPESDGTTVDACGEFAVCQPGQLMDCGGGRVETCTTDCSDPCVCIPACDGRACGDDGCGGSCGECSDGATCFDGTCSCVPQCDGRACGADGCGGVCGECSDGASCFGGQCLDADICDLAGSGEETCLHAMVCLMCIPEAPDDCDGAITAGGGDPVGPVGACLPDTHCENSIRTLGPGGQCRMFCEAGASCDLTCAATAGRSCVRCAEGSDCVTRCDDKTDICNVICDGSAGRARTCDVDCPSTTGQCVVMCNDLCRVHCANPDACYVLCPDGTMARSLGEDRYVCD